MLPQQYCLRWKYHHSNLQTMFSQLLERQAFCDVTLACEGQTIKAHKVVLSACSTYFDTILSQYEEKDPILIMKDVKFIDIKCLVEFMYKGEINVEHCHLASLLKTAEELRIKGLAEVSWRDDDVCNESSSGLNGIQSVLPQVSTVMDTSPDQDPPNKRKRGRPPIDDFDQPQNYSSPKVSAMARTALKRESHTPEVVIPDDDDDEISEWEEEPHNLSDTLREDSKMNSNQENEPYCKSDNGSDLISVSDQDLQTSQQHGSSIMSTATTSTILGHNTNALDAQWPDVIKMNDYLNTGRRQQFWEEPFTRRVMEAIKSKELEMKSAAELLGVSYGTLYGRYRDAYGCLKHPYRVRDFWTEQGPADVLAKLQRKEITLFRAAEQLNVTPQTLSNYLISLSELETSTSHVKMEDDLSDSDSNHILPDSPSMPSIVSIKTIDNITKTVLPNHPDITIIKKEKLVRMEPVTLRVNNHSDNSDQSDIEQH